MVKIFLLRHGESENNRDKIIEGISDSKLTHLGKMQAKRLAQIFKRENINAIYSSPLKRALETAKIIANKNKIKLAINNNLKEINFGHLEGESWGLVYKKIPNWRGIRYKYKPKGGETQKELENRALLFLKGIIKKHKTDTIIVVGHGSLNRAIIGSLLNINIKNRYSIMQFNGCLNLIEISGGKIRLYKLNDTNHLE